MLAHNDPGGGTSSPSSASSASGGPAPSPSPGLPPFPNGSCVGDCFTDFDRNVAIFQDVTGIGDAMDCRDGHTSGCAWLGFDIATSLPIARVPGWIGKSLAVGSKAAKLARLSAAASKAAVWALPKFERGREIERIIVDSLYPGAGLKSNFRTFDAFTGRQAISIKSIDLGAPSYSRSGAVRSRLSKYLKDIDDFDQDRLPNGQILSASAIERGGVERVLLVAYNPAAMTNEAAAAFASVSADAQRAGVSVQFVAVR